MISEANPLERAHAPASWPALPARPVEIRVARDARSTGGIGPASRALRVSEHVPVRFDIAARSGWTSAFGDGAAGPVPGPAAPRVKTGRVISGAPSTPHVPVLLAEVVEVLAAPAGGTFLDGTFGAGGYSRAILAANRANRVIAIDRDPDAIAAGATLATWAKGRLELHAGRFGELDLIAAEAGAAPLDGVVLDVGVSSMQLDRAERGFSFRFDGPLDMRMEQSGPSAADLVHETEEGELADIIYQYGEERRSRAIARAIVERRRRGRIETTGELADLVAKHVRGEPGVHPATRTFQALRIAVNDELGQLTAALDAAERALKPGGRLAVVTFHSLEDRIVKQFMLERTRRLARASRHVPDAADASPATFKAVSKGPIAPTPEEVAANSRARSAKLRVAERTEAPAGSTDQASSGSRTAQSRKHAR